MGTTITVPLQQALTLDVVVHPVQTEDTETSDAGDRDQAVRPAHDISVALSTASAGASASFEAEADRSAPEPIVRWRLKCTT